jgi:beta-N-acetylhexosaminidase
MIDLKGNPFYLKDDDIQWVESTLASMTLDEKVGQLFCLIHRSDDNWRDEADAVLKYKPSGTQFRPMKGDIAWTLANYYQGKSKIPLLIPANLERGGAGIVHEGTNYACNMQVTATDDPEMATRQGIISAREALAVGGNWAFAPCIDIDYNFRSPITNTRTYGSDPDIVAQMGIAYTEAVQSLGVAASLKHFPGDGTDERDQHLVTTVNNMSCEEWDDTYGKVYKACIDAGALTVMPGHIMHPEYSRKLRPGIKDEDIMPATLAPELLNDLLREKLGFNGLIVSDATTMVGMLVPMPREKAVPHCIAAGCDIFLFARNLEEDYGYMMKGVQDGVITEQRLDEAITRILAVKAAIGLHKKQKERNLVPLSENLSILSCEEHKQWTRECADKAVTLVKKDSALPMTLENGKRVLLYVIGDEAGPHNYTGGNSPYFKEKLEQEGFEVDVFEASGGMELRLRRYDEVVNSYDWIIYFCALMTKSNQTTTRIEWAPPLGANCPLYIASVPTIFISMENPYHLLDVPRVKNFINAYTNTEENIDAVIEKLMGRSEFKGKSPVDPFCGKWDTRLY